MKRVLIISILLIMLVLFVLPANAAQNATVTITPSATTLYAGSTVTFTVKVTGCSAAKSIGIIPTYDSSVFELVSGEWLISGSAMSDFSGGTATIAYASARAFNENVFKFTLKVKSNAALASYKVNATVSIKNGNETVPCSVSAGNVTVSCKHTYSSFSSTGTTQHQRTCTKCKAIETKSHSFANACDTTCNDCGYTRTITHSYKMTWSSNGSQHWHECSVCKDKKDVATHTPGPAATETSPQKCTVCQYVIAGVLEHVHTYGNTWGNDETGHWNTCTSCGEESSLEAHVFNNACDTSCDTCGYVRTITHSYDDDYASDSTSHWHTCTVCTAKSESETHNFENTCDTDCADCGYVRETEHSYDIGKVTKEPSQDIAGEKTYTCSLCGDKKIVELEYYAVQENTNTENNSNSDNANGSSTSSIIFAVVGAIAGAVIGFVASSLFSRRKMYKP